MQMAEKYNLHSQNIIPFYIVEDRLKQNFTAISNFISKQLTDNASTATDIAAIRADSIQFKQHIDKKLIELEKKITADIGRQLDGRIIVAINKNMASFAARMEEKEKQIGGISSSITMKMEEMKKKILFQSAKEQQKAMAKEIQQIDKKMKQTIEQAIKKNSNNSHSFGRPSSRDRNSQKIAAGGREYQIGTSHQSHFTEEWVLRIKQAEVKVAKLQDFIVSFDKRFYDSITALKQNWKELGDDVLQTKKKLTSKQDQLRLQLAKVRVIRQFEGAPEEVQQSFKSKLMLKFTDIYQLLGQLVTRTDLESEVDRIKKTFNRHDGELMELREQMSKNSDYFTFYINNSNTDDLSSQIKQLKQDLQGKMITQSERIQKHTQKHDQLDKEIITIEQKLSSLTTKQGTAQNSLGHLRQELLKEVERIDALQEHNNFTPQKLAKIHDTLDINFTPNQQQLLTKKESQFGYNAAMKEMRSEMNRMKDQLFVVSHELQQLEKVRKALSGIQGKLDKIKVDSEQAVLARKPWFCLSCDKNQKQRQEGERLRKQASRKKLQESKAALFSKEKSDKLIKLVPAGEQKFQVYEKYREKYLSDSIRLPDIYKEKIGDKEPTLI